MRVRYLNWGCVKRGIISLIRLSDGAKTDHPKGGLKSPGINKSQPTNCDEDNDKDNGKGSLIKTNPKLK
jgi:hypothetical protein